MPQRVRIDDHALGRVLRSPAGPVAGEVSRLTLRGERIARRMLSRPGDGRVYRKRNPRRTHHASAPGQPPASDTGRGRSSIGHEFGLDAQGFYGRFGTRLDYLRHLELGTKDGRILPRPWLRPSLDALAKGGP